MNDQDFDSFFRERLENETMRPSPMVWEKIEERLDEKKKRRPFIFWWWGAGIITVTGILLLVFLYLSNKQQDVQITSNNKVKKTEHPENKKTEENNNSALTAEKSNNRKTDNIAAQSDYRIQIGNYSKAINKEKFGAIENLKEEMDDKGHYHYYAGSFTDLDEAGKALNQLKNSGYSDAFVVEFKDGKNRYLSNEELAAHHLISENSVNQNQMASNNTYHTQNNHHSTSENNHTAVSNNHSATNQNSNTANTAAVQNTNNSNTTQNNSVSNTAQTSTTSGNISLQQNTNNTNTNSSLGQSTTNGNNTASISKQDSIKTKDNVIIAASTGNTNTVQKPVADSTKKDSTKNNNTSVNPNAITHKDSTANTDKNKNPNFIENNWISGNGGVNLLLNAGTGMLNGVNLGSEHGIPSFVFGLNYGRRLFNNFMVQGSVNMSENIINKNPERVKFSKYVTDYYYLPTSTSNIPIYKDTLLNGYFLAAPIDTFWADFGYRNTLAKLDGALSAGYVFKAGRFRFPVQTGAAFSYTLYQKTHLTIVKENFTQEFNFKNLNKEKANFQFQLSVAAELRLFRKSYLSIEGRLKYAAKNISETSGVKYKPLSISVPVGFKIYF